MTSASVLFYGCRRSRTLSLRSSFEDDHHHDLGFSSHSSTTTSHHHRHRKSDSHRRHRHISDHPDTSRRHPPLLHPSTRSSFPANEPPQRVCTDESPPQNTNNRDGTHDLSRRFGERDRLPGSVLLAKERLLQRLRGVSVSEVRSRSAHRSDIWLIDADREPSASRELATTNIVLTEISSGAHQQSAPQELNKKQPGLTKEILSLLHYEVFLEPQISTSSLMSEASNECSICLENFVEGNVLVSLHCGHRFHVKCLHPWLQTCGECPYCRSSVVITSD